MPTPSLQNLPIFGAKTADAGMIRRAPSARAADRPAAGDFGQLLAQSKRADPPKRADEPTRPPPAVAGESRRADAENAPPQPDVGPSLEPAGPERAPDVERAKPEAAQESVEPVVQTPVESEESAVQPASPTAPAAVADAPQVSVTQAQVVVDPSAGSEKPVTPAPERFTAQPVPASVSKAESATNKAAEMPSGPTQAAAAAPQPAEPAVQQSGPVESGAPKSADSTSQPRVTKSAPSAATPSALAATGDDLGRGTETADAPPEASQAPQSLRGANSAPTPMGSNDAVSTQNPTKIESTAPVPPPVSPQEPITARPGARFVEVNHPQIVSAVRGQLLPTGGSMQIRLDPPQLGAVLIDVVVRDGLVNASFQTSSGEAAQLLSHSLAQLKHSLESQGVSVDRLQVAHAPRGERSDASPDRNNQQQSNQQHGSGFDASRQNEQQRREMLRRMWAKLGVGDPLDLVA